MFFIKRKIVYASLSLLMLLLILLISVWYKGYYDKVTYKTLISTTGIESAWLWDENKGKKNLNQDNIPKLIKYLNNAKFVKTNDQLNGTTNPCGGGIRFTNGKHIGVFGCGDFLQIQRTDNAPDGKSYNYFIHSKEFRDFYISIMN